MTQQNPTFNVDEFELRGYTNPYLSPSQTAKVIETETRVEGQLDFLAQMLGWSGPNYWDNLPVTVDQKRQLLGGSYGVYNSFIIPKIYEIRTWDDKIVIDRLTLIPPGRQTYVSRVVVGDQVYQLQSVELLGDKYVISIGTLTQDFLDAIEAGEPLRIDVPTYRPAPFNRSSVGVSGDFSFVCGGDGTNLILYPAYDSEKRFPFKFPTLFVGSVYYFDQPIYFSTDPSLTPTVTPLYDQEKNLWYFQIPDNISSSGGLTAYLAWGNSSQVPSSNLSLEVLIQPWADPSDWKTVNVLDNFKGVWNNKGGALPFNFIFDALSIHGFNEENSVYFSGTTGQLEFNELINFVYYQKISVEPAAPPGAKIGDLWWNDDTGALSVWLPGDSGCGAWVEIDYRQSPTQSPIPNLNFTTVTAWRAALATIPQDSIVHIDDITGLQTSDNVIGLQGTLTSPGRLTLHSVKGTPYWIPDEFLYANVTDFTTVANLLPFKVPVVLSDATSLSPSNSVFTVSNLKTTITGAYRVILRKFYTNTTWEMYPDSLLKYIANTALFNRRYQGEMWWDFINTNPSVRAATVFYSSPAPISTVELLTPGSNLPDGVFANVDLIPLTGTGGKGKLNITVTGGVVTSYSVATAGDLYLLDDVVGPNPKTFPQLVGCQFVISGTTNQAWVDVNMQAQSGPPAPVLNLSTILFYCNGELLQSGVPYVTDDFIFTYSESAPNGNYEYSYNPRTFLGKTRLPTITISDSLTTAYRADVTGLVFSGITYYMSPNVFNAESPLRVWKSQALQVVNTLEHLAENNYINPLLADINDGPGADNWEKYFIRLPLEYGRNEDVWQKVALTCENLGYWGSSIEPETMRCPPEESTPKIYEELFLYDDPIEDYTYVYCEPYLYSNIAAYFSEGGDFRNAGVFPASDVEFDLLDEAEIIEYEPLHNRQANVTSAVGEGYGDWIGEYVNINPCVSLTGFYTTDLLNNGLDPVLPPVWDASIYKFAPTCQSNPESYSVDANHYKISYAYFVADASASEDTFFDVQQEIAWRDPVTQPKTGYLLPR